jgi:hypothetical protein
MPWDRAHKNSLSPHGLKAREGHGARGVHDVSCVTGREMPPGILGAPLNPDPHARAPRMPVHIAPETRRPVGEPQAIKPPHDPSPHPYSPAAQKQAANTYAKPRWEK